MRGFIDKGYYSKYEQYVNEQFVFRGWLIKLKNWLDYYIFDTSPTLKAYVAQNGWIYFYDGLWSYMKSDCNMKVKMYDFAREIQNLEKVLEASGRKFVFVIAPNKATIYPEHVGIRRATRCNKSRYDLLLDAFKDYPVKSFVRLDNLLIRAKDKEQVYYRTDSHWNIRGAMIMSEAILRHLARDTWTRYFPEIKIVNRKQTKDLANLMGLNISENTYFAETISYRSEVRVENLKPLENGYELYRTIAKPHPGERLLPRAVIYRDSFMEVPMQILKGSFDQSYVIWTHDILTPEALRELKASKIVILELVERKLPVMIDSKKIETILKED